MAMRYLRPHLVIIGIVAMLSACADLTVQTVAVTWNETEKKATAVIKNESRFSANDFLVYFDADENPVSQNRRPQVSHHITSLSGGASVALEADFDSLAHPDNSRLANVYQITVRADPKNQVRESNEDNNDLSEAISTDGGSNVVSHNLLTSGNWVINSLYKVKQTVLVTNGGTLAGIELSLLRCTASSPTQFIVEFGQGTTVLGTASMYANDMPGQNQCGVIPPDLEMNTIGPGYFIFSGQNIVLQAGQQYFIYVYGDDASDMRAGHDNNGIYGDGSALHNGNPTNSDLVFKVLVE